MPEKAKCKKDAAASFFMKKRFPQETLQEHGKDIGADDGDDTCHND